MKLCWTLALRLIVLKRANSNLTAMTRIPAHGQRVISCMHTPGFDFQATLWLAPNPTLLLRRQHTHYIAPLEGFSAVLFACA